MATELLVRDLKKLLRLFFWASFCFWMALWILLPTIAGERLVLSAKRRTPSFAGDFGATLIVYSAPVIAFSIFSILFLHLKRTYPDERSSGRLKRLHGLMWTQPLLTRGPLGVATGFDILAATVTLAAVTWIFFKTLDRINAAGSRSPKYGASAGAFSRAALLPLSLLCFPVSRGSPLLRMIGLPFQQAVKYHRWLGHLTLALYCTHSVLFICVFITVEHDASKLLRWPVTGISYMAGTIAFAAGIVMWITSVAPVRRKWFELFYATHHLYLVFFTFLVLHVGAKASAHAAGGVFLFLIDRFIRLVQARHGLSLAATKVYSSGVVELKLRKSPGVHYTPLSSVFINIPCVSRLQWHPFSVTSSARDGSQTLTLCIKPDGEWTTRLHRALVASDSKATPSSAVFSNALFAEGPYGYDGSESNFFLRYDALVLVAGGIGIAPFIAVLRDLFHRCQANERRLPKSVQIIWSVKRGSELVLLTDVFPATRFSTTAVHLECHAFVTGRGKESSLMQETESTMAMDFPNVSGCEGSLSSVAATGNGLWIASLIAVASCATILVMYVLDRSTSQHVALLYFGSTLTGIGGFGGIVMVAWSILRNFNSGEQSKSIITGVYEKENTLPLPDRENVWQRNLLDRTRVMRGRPNIRKCLDAAADAYRGKEVGVLVCGPESLRRSVATECNYHYMSSSAKSPFYFHSLSFDI